MAAPLAVDDVLGRLKQKREGMASKEEAAAGGAAAASAGGVVAQDASARGGERIAKKAPREPAAEGADRDGGKSGSSRDRDRDSRRRRSRSRSRERSRDGRDRSRSPRRRSARSPDRAEKEGDKDGAGKKEGRSRSRDREEERRRDRRRSRSRSRSRDRVRGRGEREYVREREFRGGGGNRRDDNRGDYRSSRYDDRYERRGEPSRPVASGPGIDAGSRVNDLLSRVLGLPPPMGGAVTASATAAIQATVAGLFGGGGGAGAPVPAPALVPGISPALPDVQSLLAKLQTGALASINTASKIARELYIGGLPAGAGLTAAAIKDYFNAVMTQAGMLKPGALSTGLTPVLTARMSDGGAFAFLEMRSAEEADAGITLNGLQLLGAAMRIGRPKAYIDRFGNVPAVVAVEMLAKGVVPGAVGGASAASLGAVGGGSLAALGMSLGAGINPVASNLLASLGLASGPGGFFGPSAPSAASQGKGTEGTGTDMTPPAPPPPSSLPYIPALLATNVNPALKAEGVNALFDSFGEIRQVMFLAPSRDGTARILILFRDALSTPPSKLDEAIAGLQGFELGGLALKLDKPGSDVLAEAGVAVPAIAAAPMRALPPPPPPSCRILELQNIVLAGSIAALPPAAAAEELNDIREDVSEECGRFGRVTQVYMPPLTTAQRGAGGSQDSIPVFVLFDSAAAAAACADKMRGRLFEQRVVGLRFLSDSEYSTLRAATGGEEGGSYGGVSVPPPPGGEGVLALPLTSAQGAPEDGLVLPAGPEHADLD
jgi:hypothetical protein